MKQKQGFTAIHALLVVLIIGVIGAVGYGIYQKNHSTSKTVTVKKTVIYSGPTASVDSSLDSEISTESKADAQASASDQSNASSADQAATNVGGAYDENAN